MLDPSLLDRAKQVMQLEISELQSMLDRLDDSILQAASILKETVENGGKTIVVGIGKSGNIGHKIAATLNSTGSTAVVLNGQNALHGDLGLISDGDAVIALSYSGETPELLNLLPFLKRFDLKIISLTGKVDSTLARESTVTLDTSVSREACPLKLAPTSSSTAMLVMGDALAMCVLDARGFTEEDFARFHPGGTLGRALLTRVRDIMRYGAELPLATPDSSIHEAITAMSKSHSGACILLNENQTLAGIFTHGDFARAFQSDPDIGSKKVGDYMSPSPITVFADALAAEALQTIGSHKVDDIVVLDKDGKPVGLIDTQDLARLKLI